MHEAIRNHLAVRGASFFPQIVQAVGGFPADVLEALWDLVWQGEVTNDTLQPLRSYLVPPRAARASERRRAEPPRRRPIILGSHQAAHSGYNAPSRAIPPEAAGRWSLVSSLVFGEPGPTERLTAQAQQMLERYGVLTREAVQAEGVSGGFSAVYGVLKAMEEAGRVRRGYFVSGLGATQFAVPGAVDRLRAVREPGEQPESMMLAATDPANPYGAALPWPESVEGPRPMRLAGAHVILVDGRLAAWLGRGERQISTFLDCVDEDDRSDLANGIALALGGLVESGRRRGVLISEVDGKPAADSHMAAAFERAGFRRTLHGYQKRL